MILNNLIAGLPYQLKTRRNIIVRNRWRKALTLVINPVILMERLEAQVKAKQRRTKEPSKMQMAAVSTYFGYNVSDR